MHVRVDVLKNFLDIINFTINGDLCATKEKDDECITANVKNVPNNVNLHVKLRPSDSVVYEENEIVDFLISAGIFKDKYLKHFDGKGEVGIVTTDDVITISDGKLMLNMMQIQPVSAANGTPSKTVKELRKILPKPTIHIEISPADIIKMHKIAVALDITDITFTINDDSVELSVGNKASMKVDAEIEKSYEKEWKIDFRSDAILDAFRYAASPVKIEFITDVARNDDKRIILFPAFITYTSGTNNEIEVEGCIVPNKIYVE